MVVQKHFSTNLVTLHHISEAAVAVSSQSSDEASSGGGAGAGAVTNEPNMSSTDKAKPKDEA